jgi:two-component system chemotaxis sensor kinase CheA
MPMDVGTGIPVIEGPSPAVPRVKAADIIAPAGTEIVIRICVRADTQLVGARALIARRNAERVAVILAAVPEEFGEGFDGEFRLFVASGSDRTELEKVIRAAGDIETVEFEAPISAPTSRAADNARNRTRHVRVDQRRIDDLADGIGELSILRARLADVVKHGRADALYDLIERMRRLVDEVQNVALAMRMVPVGEVFDRFPRMVRDAARSLGKDVDFRVEGRDIELDRSVLDEIADPLVHLLRNSLDHGIESAAVRESAGKSARALVVLRAESGRASVRVSVRDDGGGINRARVREKGIAMGLLPSDARALLNEEELLRVMGSPGFSTAAQVTDVSGRGVGLDAVLNKVRSLGGVIELKSAESEGTTFTLVLPITLAVAHSLRVRVAGEQYAIPLTHVSEVVEIHNTVRDDDGRELLLVREERIPLVRLRALLSPGSSDTERAAVISEIGERRTALAVDELVMKEQIYVKSFDPAAGTLPIFSGVTLLADGRPILVLDPISVS